MELFIRVKNGQPFEHPIFGDNFRQAFPDIDVNNLPEGFARFIRVTKPVIGVYEVYEGVSYEWDGTVYTDVHHIRPMTIEERQIAIDNAYQYSPGPNWILDLETLQWVLPN